MEKLELSNNKPFLVFFPKWVYPSLLMHNSLKCSYDDINATLQNLHMYSVYHDNENNQLTLQITIRDLQSTVLISLFELVKDSTSNNLTGLKFRNGLYDFASNIFIPFSDSDNEFIFCCDNTFVIKAYMNRIEMDSKAPNDYMQYDIIFDINKIIEK